MSEKGTLEFYFIRKKADVYAAQVSPCELIQSAINEYSPDQAEIFFKFRKNSKNFEVVFVNLQKPFKIFEDL